jgi:pimeloyl-ACP methyl ester carboxylesterase
MKKHIVLSFCLIFSASTSIYAQSAGADSLYFPPMGKLFDIGGYRLHLNCTGKGDQTVVFISGARGFSFDWLLVQKELETEAKLCSYDRPGIAWSDVGPLPRHLAQDAYELHKLLKAAKLKPPYILVGQSLGGLIARKFAREYPKEIAGLILVDATSENSLLGVKGKIERMRLLASPDKKLPSLKDHPDSTSRRIAQEKMAGFSKTPGKFNRSNTSDKWMDSISNLRSWAQTLPKYSTSDGADFWAEEFAQIYNDSLSYRIGKKPLVVIASTKNEYPAGWDMRDSMMNEKLNNQKRFLSISSNSKLVTTQNSGHEIHLKEPALVVDAIRLVLKAVRTGVFSTAAVSDSDK